MSMSSWFAIRADLTQQRRLMLGVGSFLLPILIWCLVSYVPAVWHPMVQINRPGDVDYFQVDMLVEKETFKEELKNMEIAGKALPEGTPANPIYLPAPHQVLGALYTSFTTPPLQKDGLWLHQSLWSSVKIIFWGFLISSLIGVPLGIFCGTFGVISRLFEPFIEFFRYLPAPAFGALAVAILGIYGGPKIAIIVIGTFFQQVLIIANTTRKIDYALIEAAMTLGSNRIKLIGRVILPGIMPDLYRDQRILLGWAWTYLIVAELIGTSSGITWFITQQARYEHFENVYAAIFIIGLIGLVTDLFLAWIGKKLFPWDKATNKV
mgnify:FL=1